MKQLIKKGLRRLKFKFVPYNSKYKPLGVNKIKDNIDHKEIFPTFQSSLQISKELSEACTEYIRTPRVVTFPPAQVIEIPNGRLYATNAYIAVIDQTNYLIPQVSYHYVSINKLGLSDENTVFRNRFFINPVKYPGTLFTMLSGGGAVTNYGHWLIDAIPRVGLLKKSGWFDSVDWFLAPNYKYDYQQDTLSLLGIPKEKVIVANEVNHIIADKIIATSNTRHIGHFPVWALEFLRNAFLDQIKPEQYPEFVYIRRSDSSIRRVINEEELVAQLKPLGFVDYELSKLSFSQKVNLFRSAKVVVGATGAGLSNLIFCNPKTKILEIFHSTFISTMFADMANNADLDYHYIIKDGGKKAKTIKEGEIGHFMVDIDPIIQKVKDLL